MPAKSRDLMLLGEKPLVAQTPEHLLDDETTPTELLFIRNNGQMPRRAADPERWKLTIDGEVESPLTLTLADIKSRYQHVTRHLVVECGGNGRSFFEPIIRGNRWTNGGVACPAWTGVRLSDLLRDARVKPSAVFSGHYGADTAFSGEPGKPALSRGVPIEKLLDDNNLLVWAVNGEPLPLEHGFPLRLVIPGWPGSVSQKWLTRIWIRDRRHDGYGMGGIFYRVPIKPAPPPRAGEKYDKSNLTDLESMPVRAIATYPADGATVQMHNGAIEIRGASWAGDYQVAQVDVSADGGANWHRADVSAPRNRYDWQRWCLRLPVQKAGPCNVWVRATDERGVAQPLTPDNWNPHGCGGNAVHRIKLVVTDS